MNWRIKLQNNNDQCYSIWPAMTALLLLRCWMMLVIPLNDTTESRYSEMARKMMSLGDWITLWHYPNVPFWGKPPFTIWLSAISMKFLGVSAFVSRLPSLILAIFTLMLIYKVVKDFRSKSLAIMTIFVLASSCFFFIGAGTVMMDPALVFSIVVCQVSFWYAMHSDSKVAGYLFFIGGALGLLAKGPVSIIFSGGGIIIWVLLESQWSAFCRRLPWIQGLVLLCLIAGPWYWLAEQRTPGFLNYFIVGEHFKRFFEPGWQGNLYGFAHNKPFGMVWLYAWTNFLPWSIPMIFGLCIASYRKAWLSVLHDDFLRSWSRYWLSAALFPLIFFTFCHNMVLAYAMPALPGIAIIFSEVWQRFASLYKLRHLLRAFFIVMVVITSLYVIKPEWIAKSQNRMVQLWYLQDEHSKNPLLYFIDQVPFSGYFYTNGHVKNINNFNLLCQSNLDTTSPIYIVVNQEEWRNCILKNHNRGRCSLVGSVHRVDYDEEYLIMIKNLRC